MTAPPHVLHYLDGWLRYERGLAARPSCFAFGLHYLDAAWVRWWAHAALVASGQPHVPVVE